MLARTLCIALILTFTSRLPADEVADAVTEKLFEQYVLWRGKISTRDKHAAIQLVASRSYHSRPMTTRILAEFDRAPNDRALLAVLTKMLSREGAARRAAEAVRKGGAPPQAALATAQVGPLQGAQTPPPSTLLAHVLRHGRTASRNTIGDFVLALRQAYHPGCKGFLLDVLTNPPNKHGKWPDNVGDTWTRARFHAAVALAELGDARGIDWLIARVGAPSSGYVHRGTHAEVPNGSLRENCLHALADLTRLSPKRSPQQWSDWWQRNREFYEPAKPVTLRID